MILRPRLLTGAVVIAVGALTLAGCSTGPSISPLTVGQGSTFCKDTQAFQVKAAALEAAATSGDLAATRTATDDTVAALQTLQKDAAPLPDRVGGHLVKDDVGVAASTFEDLQKQLASASASDPQALNAALKAVNGQHGQAFTAVTDRLDAYTKRACGLSVYNPTTTVPGSTTTAAPAGPTVGPTTSAAATTATTGGTVTSP